MAQYFTDFGQVNENQVPDDWTLRWNSSGAVWEVRPDGGATGGKVLFHNRTSGTGRSAISWDALDADPDRDTCEIVFRWRSSSSSIARMNALLRASGTSSESGYCHGLSYDFFSGLRATKYVNGTPLTIDSQSLPYSNANTWMVTRVRVEGTTHRVKHWLESEGEPAAWDIETTDSSITSAGWTGLFQFSGGPSYEVDWFGVGTAGDAAPSAPVEQPEEPPEEPGIAFTDGLVSEGSAVLFDDGFTGVQELTLVTDVDAGNVSPTLSSVTNAADQSPTVFVDTRPTASDGTGGTGWRHLLFAVENSGGKTPVFRLNRATMDRNTQAIGTEYRPSYTTDFKTWVQAPSRTLSGGSSGYIEFQFTDPLPSGRVYVCSQPITPNSYAGTFAADLLSDYSAVASPAAQADGSGVYNVTPIEQDDLGREIGGNNQYAIKLAFGGSTTDGGPKRKLVALAGIHAAGEQVSWIPYESFIRWALDSQTQEAANLRANWDIWLYFNITPNGLRGGHRRHNFRNTIDPNRDFVNRQLQEIDALRTAVETEVGTCDCFLSFHGYNGGDGTLYIPGYYTGSGQETQDFISIGQTVFGVAPLSYGITSTDTDMAWGTTVLNAPVSVAAEFWSRDHTSYERLHSDGEKWAQTLQAADAQGLFYQPEEGTAQLFVKESFTDSSQITTASGIVSNLSSQESPDTISITAKTINTVEFVATEQFQDSVAITAQMGEEPVPDDGINASMSVQESFTDSMSGTAFTKLVAGMSVTEAFSDSTDIRLSSLSGEFVGSPVKTRIIKEMPFTTITGSVPDTKITGIKPDAALSMEAPDSLIDGEVPNPHISSELW